MTVEVIHGDCLDVLAGMGDSSVDSIVTDPPYEIGFMSKGWDGSGIAYRVELWAECLRVLKPGGHLLAFGGTRTYHRMASAIDDAGFDIRDSLHWLYGSGFPKSLDVSKAIDKAAGAERAVVGQATTPYKVRGMSTKQSNKGWERPSHEHWEVDDNGYRISTTTAPATDAAKQWEGWGTALKPAHEPIVVARKPLTGTVAANVLTHGTGALNIDGSRVGSEERTTSGMSSLGVMHDDNWQPQNIEQKQVNGRWPANLVFTHAADCADRCADGCPVAELDGQSDGASRFFTTTEWHPTADVPPFRYVAKPSKRERNAGLDGLETKHKSQLGTDYASRERLDDVSARFVSAQPVANVHPTVKPVALMRWLVRLVTPPGGTVLDPFAGSGTTLVAATLEGFHAIGIEMTDDYHPIIAGRVEWAETYTGTPHPARAPTTPRTPTPTTQPPLTLFDVGATE